MPTRQQVKQIFSRFQSANPQPATELNYQTAFELLIAVILSAHTTDKSVNIATQKLFPIANTPASILALGEEGLKSYIKNVGLYNAKAANIIATCRILVEQYQGQVPPTFDALISLPGVGRKTANVVLNTIFREPVMAVDTHIFRVANRTGIAPGKNVREVEKKLLKMVPKEFLLDAHHWLILHGRYTCIARKPRCAVCIISDCCDYYANQPRT
jgi:endonuclease-3